MTGNRLGSDMMRLLPHRVVFVVACVMLAVSVAVSVPGTAEGQGIKKKEWLRALAKAQEDYRVYFTPPRKPEEYWVAIDFELEVGKYDVAAVFIEQLLSQPKDATDAALLKIEEAKGLSHFLRLRSVPRWFKDEELNNQAIKNANTLIERVTNALEKRLSDPVRLQKYVALLNAPTPEERDYAYVQLRRARHRAARYLLSALRTTAGTPQQSRIVRAMLALDSDTLTPFLEVLTAGSVADFKDETLRPVIIEIFRKRKDLRALPYLWHLSAGEKYPISVRNLARGALAELLGIEEKNLPDPKVQLTRLAKRYAEHRIRYLDVVRPVPKPGTPTSAEYRIKVWPWDGKDLPAQPLLVPATEADYIFAHRYAHQALDLDPGYLPAQELMLRLLMEQRFGRGINEFVLKPMEKKHYELVATLEADLLLRVLDQALSDDNLPVALPLIRILGDRGEIRAVRASTTTRARGLARALYYPDRRVQFEAVRAVTKIRGNHSTVIRVRVLEILRRFLQTPQQGQLLLIGFPDDSRLAARKTVNDAGWQAVFATRVSDIMQAIRRSAAIDAILIHSSYPRGDLPFLLANLRQDIDSGRTPILMLAPLAQHDELKLYTLRYANVYAALEGILALPAELQAEVETAVNRSLAPRYVATLLPEQRRRVLERLAGTGGARFTDKERQALFTTSVAIAWDMALGKIPGYDLTPVKPAIENVMLQAKGETAAAAIQTYATFPGAEVQQKLLGFALDANRDVKLRRIAAAALVKHVNQQGLYLNRFQIDDVRRAHLAEKDEAMRRSLAVLVGTIPRSRRVTGIQLREFQP